ncbi:hypothetical protein E5843_08875 [Luteimonas yindakuii]|uniref:hypothetical protein n=1 Tax=Luteimonas yindakuii TaxID=2565782 RepID=UPI0010A4CC85|nr:hypothetical protein [Luteimonas yindakuii]QCO67850.1 hypothetical protein E5843_08875 [Luteimonas yindakuii]
MVENVYDDFITILDSSATLGHSERFRLASTHYAATFPGFYASGGLKRLSDRDLYFLQLAAESLLALSFFPEAEEHAVRSYRELVSRGNMRTVNVNAYYTSMIYAAKFDAAREVEDYVTVPRITVRTRTFALADQRRVVHAINEDRRSFDLRVEDALVDGIYFVGHPFCRWTRNALSDLGAHAEAAAVLETNTVFLAPKNTILQGRDPTDGVPEFAVVMNQADWPEIAIWTLPTIVFIKDGTPFRTISGWPAASRVPEFVDAVRVMRESDEPRR